MMRCMRTKEIAKEAILEAEKASHELQVNII